MFFATVTIDFDKKMFETMILSRSRSVTQNMIGYLTIA